jgi:deoxyribonuclease IV
MTKPLLIGAHTSAAGGAPNALLQGQEIGATTIQLFTSNQKQWQGRKISEEEVIEWKEALKATGINHVMSHDSYLINLGSPKEDSLQKSRSAFRHELERCHLLEISYLNFHPGAALDSPEEACLKTIVESLLEFKELVDKGPTRLLIETTAGQGSSVGHNFEQIGYLIRHLHPTIRIGVCIDTCHIFAAGYDIRTKEAWDHTLKQFDEHIGLQHLYAMHLNDSLKDLGSRVDRHASLGEGKIGIECFKVVMTHPKLQGLPKYLETPESEKWKEEIALLRNFAS